MKKKKAQREPWLELTKVEIPGRGYYSLCSFCQYAEWEGHCEEAALNCQHQLYAVSEYAYDTWEGNSQDCWGFRPKVSWDTATRMIENRLLDKDVILPDELIMGRKK